MDNIICLWLQHIDSLIFKKPEFYENGVVVSVFCNDKTFDIYRDGKASLDIGNDTVLSSPHEFQSAFPDGKLNDDDINFVWYQNAWFDVYGEDGESLDMVSFDIDEMLDSIVELLTAKDDE